MLNVQQIHEATAHSTTCITWLLTQPILSDALPQALKFGVFSFLQTMLNGGVRSMQLHDVHLFFSMWVCLPVAFFLLPLGIRFNWREFPLCTAHHRFFSFLFSIRPRNFLMTTLQLNNVTDVKHRDP